MSSSQYFKEVVGIIGGIGPEATNYFTTLLTKAQRLRVNRDQDYVPFLVFTNPQIPDRTQHLVFHKESPVPQLAHTGLTLKSAGATFLAMPCNTSHAYIEDLQKMVGLPVLNMVRLTIEYIAHTYGEDARIGLLATDGTIKTSIYEREIVKVASRMRLVLPDELTQRDVTQAIYDIKSSSATKQNSKLLKKAGRKLIAKGAEVIVMGCTEIPLAVAKGSLKVPLIDPMEVLAHEVVQKTLSSATVPQKHFWHFIPGIPAPRST